MVDNNIMKCNKLICERYKRQSKFNLFYLIELKKGIVFARNKFLNYIYSLDKKIDIVGFLDDDCIVEKKWLNSHISLLKESNSQISTGPQLKKNYLNTIDEQFYKLTNIFINKNKVLISWAATNNVILKYKCLNKQLFDKNLNNIGGSDQLFFLKLYNNGNKIIWNLNASVFEMPTMSKTKLSWFKNRNIRYGFSGAYMHTNIYGKYYGIFLIFLKSFYYAIKILLLFLFIPKRNQFMKINMFFFRLLGIFKFIKGKKIKNYY